MGDSEAPIFRDEDPLALFWSDMTTEASSWWYCTTYKLSQTVLSRAVW
jgi:hypothetical protein